ncbi:hypothetical protein ACH5RR_023307 [Cinchona calisaya]|uniref:Uncharacterized protein n=1 Tax=Cinchona calisaya TaxID=153742 RepID=A0ABD2ZDR2_9GENT
MAKMEQDRELVDISRLSRGYDSHVNHLDIGTKRLNAASALVAKVLSTLVLATTVEKGKVLKAVTQFKGKRSLEHPRHGFLERTVRFHFLDFTKLSGDDHQLTMEHIGRFTIQCREGHMNGMPVLRMMVNNEAAVNILPASTMKRLGKMVKDLNGDEAEMVKTEPKIFLAEVNAVEAVYYHGNIGPH